jgi:hypothetical protein
MPRVRDGGTNERRALIILLVRAFEESDPEGLVLRLRERNKATRRAMMVTGLSGQHAGTAALWRIRTGEAVMRRARMLFDGLLREVHVVGRLARLVRFGASTTPLVLSLSLLLGLAASALDLRQRVNVVSLPLIGLLAWNAGVVAARLLLPLVRRSRARRGVAALLSSLFFKGAMSRRVKRARVSGGRVSSESRIVVRAAMRFGAMWNRLAGPLLAARLERTLHLGAITIVAGVLAGMCGRGLAFEYPATWHSTWLDAAQVQRLLDTILGPAARLLDMQVPDVAPLASPGGSGPVLPWLRLYGMTALLIVVLPRGLLAAYEGFRVFRLSNAVPLDLEEPYYRRLFTAWRGAMRQVEIVPYGYTPRPGALAALKTLMYDYFGARADVRIVDALPYGAPAGELLGGTGARAVAAPMPGDAVEPETCVVVLLNLAQSPDGDLHGALLRDLTLALDPAREQMLVVLDMSASRDRLGDPAHVRERIDAWSRVVHGVGLTALPIDLERHLSPAGAVGDRTKGTAEELLGAVHAALWPDSFQGSSRSAGIPARPA